MIAWLTVISAGALWTAIWRHQLLLTGAHGDFFWSWRVGQWEWHHHAVLSHNPAAWNGTALAHTWINIEWGWQGILGALAPHLAHAPALIALLFISWIMWGVAVFAFARLWFPKDHTPLGWLSASLFLWSLFAIGFWTLRPQILSVTFWVSLLIILTVSRRQQRWLYALPLLAGVWANLHGDFLLIGPVVGLDILVAGLHRQWVRVRALSLALLATGLAISLATPFHFTTITYSLSLAFNPWIGQAIGEWAAPRFATPFWIIVLLLWGSIAIAWRYHPQAFSRRLTGWWAATVLATCWHSRYFLYNIPLDVPMLAQTLQYWAFPLALPTSRRAMAGIALLSASVTALCWPVSWSRYYAVSPWPTALIAFVRHHPTSGLTLVPYSQGGFWEAHHIARIYIDGRADFFLTHSTRFQSYLQWQSGTLPLQQLRQQGVTRIIWPTHTVPEPLAPPAALAVDQQQGYTVWNLR